MGKAILAVLAGYGLLAVLVVLTDVAASALMGYHAHALPPRGYMVFSLVTSVVYTVAGGSLCARIAARRRAAALWGLIALGEALGIVSSALTWSQTPHFYAIGLIVLFPPAVWLGGRLAPHTAEADYSGGSKR